MVDWNLSWRKRIVSCQLCRIYINRFLFLLFPFFKFLLLVFSQQNCVFMFHELLLQFAFEIISSLFVFHFLNAKLFCLIDAEGMLPM